MEPQQNPDKIFRLYTCLQVFERDDLFSGSIGTDSQLLPQGDVSTRGMKLRFLLLVYGP